MKTLSFCLKVICLLLIIGGFFQLSERNKIIAQIRSDYCCEDGDCQPYKININGPVMCSQSVHIQDLDDCGANPQTKTCMECIDRESKQELCLLKESNEYCCLVDPALYGNTCPKSYKYCVDLDFYIGGPYLIPPNEPRTWYAEMECPTKSPYSYKWYRMVICPGGGIVPKEGTKDLPCGKWFLVGTSSTLTLSVSMDFLLKLEIKDGRNHTYISEEKPVRIDRDKSTLQFAQGYPNPFNSTTKVIFTLNEGGITSVNVFNVYGQKVRTLMDNEYLTSGNHTISWNGKNDFGHEVSSGTYFCQITSMNRSALIRLIFMK